MAMQLYPLKLVIIVGETLIMKKIAQEGLKLGATGYTLTDVEGNGPRSSLNVANTLGGKSQKLEFIVPNDVATAILLHVHREYFENYSIAAWQLDVQVVRGEVYMNTSPRASLGK